MLVCILLSPLSIRNRNKTLGYPHLDYHLFSSVVLNLFFTPPVLALCFKPPGYK